MCRGEYSRRAVRTGEHATVEWCDGKDDQRELPPTCEAQGEAAGEGACALYQCGQLLASAVLVSNAIGSELGAYLGGRVGVVPGCVLAE